MCDTTILDGVLKAARGLELLREGDELKELDSLDVLDMVVELERVLATEIPTPEISMEHFESVETVCAWLARLGR